jgi:D-threonate/D-erythronate kinase
VPCADADLLVLADDATGALEMGALLAPSTVWLGVTAPSGVVDTESRHLSADQATAHMREALTGVAPTTRIFKKIDSTLRGPIAAELIAITEAFPGRRLIVCPAYPQLARTVVDGKLLVHGVPVDQTDFARDPRWPVKDAAIRWGEVHDAQTDQDLVRIARLCDEQCIGVGSGGLARWLLAPGGPPRAEVPRGRRWLVVCGSMHPVSLRQAERAKGLGVDVVSGVNAAQEAIGQRPAAMIIFGGETTFHVLRGLGVDHVRTLGEVLPGVPLSLAGDMPVITKAGGFGTDDLVATILGEP